MSLKIKHKDFQFGIGDRVRVIQRIKEGDKKRLQAFEGMVIAIKGREENKTFTVRRIGAQQIGIERIFPLISPTIETVEVVKKGTRGVRSAKLYYTRDKSKKEIDKIYKRVAKRGKVSKKITKKTTSKAKNRAPKKTKRSK